MTETPPLVAFLVILGPPFAFGFLLGWWLRGRRATSAEAERQRLRQTELPSPKQIDYILSLAKRRGVKGRRHAGVCRGGIRNDRRSQGRRLGSAGRGSEGES